MGRYTCCSSLCCVLSILASFAAAGIVALVICGIGYSASVQDLCDTETQASVESAFFAPKLQNGQGFMSDGSGLCILDVNFSYDGTGYNRTLYASCWSCGDFYQHPESQSITICFKGSPEGSDVLLAHGKSGIDVTSRRTTLKWRVALAVSGGIAAGCIIFMILSCWLDACISAYKRKVGTTSVVVPIGLVAREQELFQKF